MKVESDLRLLEERLQSYRAELELLKYHSTLTARSLESVFRTLFGRTLRDLQGTHSDDRRCFVVGNGPSLTRIDMSRLRDEVTLGSNRVFIGFQSWGFEFDYWMVQDRILADQSALEFARNLSDDITKFIPYSIIRHFDTNCMKNVVPLHLDYTKPFYFSDDPFAIGEGFTVTFGLLQVAVILGFREIVLVGVDHNYVIPEENVTDDRKWSGRGLSNHFSESYTNYEQGQVWEMPDIEKMSRAYLAAADWASKNGIKIVNASPDTRLEAFPLIDFESLF